MCDPVPQQDFQLSNEVNTEVFMTPFMFADRGECPFSKKVRNMEDAGAGLAIIANNNEKNID